MKVLLILSFFALLCNARYDDVDIIKNWISFRENYFKTYGSRLEEIKQLRKFLDNAGIVKRHNARFEIGEVSYKLEINHFSDLAKHEFQEIYANYRPTTTNDNRIKGATYIRPHEVELPSSKDWRIFGAVTPMKDQGKCVSCWAFSTTGSLEGQQFRKTGDLVSLSEQNLIDCSGWLGNFGCSGGETDLAFQYAMSDGIDTEESYPYQGINGTCRYNASQIGATASGFMDIGRGDEDELQAAVATMGPVSVVINAKDSFRFYAEGVYYEPECSSKDEDLNHAVLVVGYGTDDKTGMDYWLVKNSWGTDWGEEGYAKMARNKDNNCGIATKARFPLV
ncbi:Hypothetical predicted protein [Cloeon dipterum]|uniref:Cathepsin L n=1 Tax=Cloeon dipterum TaxID=197152 RepID=A0A8S1CQ54_9INSE|nr:Hypothetical predicted protein [Cloeon dipterum]